MKKRTKLPNGFGCIKKLSGNRKRPYAAYPTSQIGGAAPHLCPMRAIGYYEDWYSAYNAIVDFNSSLQPPSPISITLSLTPNSSRAKNSSPPAAAWIMLLLIKMFPPFTK